MGRRSKYTPEIVDLILDAIKQTGSDKAGWQSGGINHDTFYTWISRHSEFSEGVAQAKSEFRKLCPQSFVQRSRQVLYDYLFTGHVEHWSVSEVHKDAEGNIFKTVERTSKAIKPTPYWVIDRVLGKNLPLLEAVRLLLSQGVATTEQARVVSDGVSRIEEELKALSGSGGQEEGSNN